MKNETIKILEVLKEVTEALVEAKIKGNNQDVAKSEDAIELAMQTIKKATK